MKLITNNTIVTNAIWSRDQTNIDFDATVFELDEIPENKNLIIDIMLCLAGFAAGVYTVQNSQLFKNNVAAAVVTDSDRLQMKAEYQNMITRLDQIQAASNPTNAQIVQAIKDEALYIERILKTFRRMLT